MQQLNTVGKYTAQILKYAIIWEFVQLILVKKRKKKNVPVPGTLASVLSKTLTDEEFVEFTARIQAQFQEFPSVSRLNCQRPVFHVYHEMVEKNECDNEDVSEEDESA